MPARDGGFAPPLPRVGAQSCPVNPDGGPGQLRLRVGAGASDFDLGVEGDDFHNLFVPNGSQLDLCLQGCDAGANPLCSAYGGALSVAGAAFGPPTPIATDRVSVCLVLQFTYPPSGQANVQTGAVDVSAGLSGSAFVTLFPPPNLNGVDLPALCGRRL